MTRARALELDAAAYTRSPLHGDSCVWVEKNCYIDIWIEVLHALGLEPRAALPFTVAIDFEGDQWTFFKPPHDELRELYGIDVQEMNVWRPLIEHAVEHLRAGKMISTEADAFWLPDTQGTDYRRTHTKSTIVIADLDTDAKRLGYFHNASYYELSGEDFIKTFRLDCAPDPTYMPLFAELVRTDRVVKRPQAELLDRSRALLKKHLERRPSSNPITRFRTRFERDLPQIQERGLAYYHAWAFGTIRQLGAASELAAIHLDWLVANGDAALAEPASAFRRIATSNKTLILKVARAVNARRPLDGAALFDEMAQAWEAAMAHLASQLAR